MRPEKPLSRKALIFAAILVSLAAFSTAQTVDLEGGDNEFWLNSDAADNGNVEVSFKAQCSDYSIEGSGNAADYFEYNEQEEKAVAVFDTENSFDYSLFGDYSIDLNCREQNETGSFTLKRLETGLSVEGSKNVFRGDSIDLSANVNVLGGSNVPDYTVYLRSSQETYEMGENKNSVTIPENVEPGPAALELRSSVDSSQGEVEEKTLVGDLTVIDPWTVEVSNESLGSSLVEYEKLEEFQRDVRVAFKNDPVNYKTSESFFLTVERENGSAVSGLEKKKSLIKSKMISTDGKYRISFSALPRLSVGKYNFKIGLEHDKGDVILDEFQVDNYVRFSGIVIDSAGSAVDTKIEVVRDRTSPGISSSNGEYSASLLPDDYNMTFSFPEMTIDFWNVRINQDTVDFRGDNQPIRYNDLTANRLEGAVQGATVLNAVAVDFAIPFEEAHAVMDYDSSKAAFDEVEVMQCSQWVGDECSGEWEATDRNSTEVDLGQVSFPVQTSSANGQKILRNAFMVIKNTDLVPKDLALEDDRIPVGGLLPLSGKVESAEGNAVANVEVNVTVRNGNEYLKSQVVDTSNNGRFQTKMKVPEKSGTYSIDLRGEKQPFNGFKSEDIASFDTYIPRELSIETPDSTEFYIGKKSEMSFDVINTGSAEAKDVKLRVSDLKNTWYEFQQQQWSSLQPGDSREALMRVDLPEDYCDSECKEYPTFSVEVVGTSGGKELNTVESVQAVVTKKNQTEVSGNQSSSGGLKLESPEVFSATGDFLESQSSLNLVLALVMIFMLILAGAVKHNQKGGNRGGRSIGSRGSGGRPNVQKPNVSTSSQSQGRKGGNDEGTESSSEEDSEDDVLKCNKCGEEFDTQSALEIHKQAIH